MKIIHLIPNLRKGGAERLCIDTCRALQEKEGVEVLLIQFSPENAYSFLTEGLNRKVIPSQVIPSIRGKSTIEIGELQQEIHTFQPDVIHVHLFESLMVASHLKFHGHLVVHFHDNMVQFENFSWRTVLTKRAFTNFLEKQIILRKLGKRNVTYLGISTHTFEFMDKVLPLNSRKKKLLNAINTKLFDTTKDIVKKNELTTIGSLVPKKAQQIAIQTIAELIKRGISVRLNILGEGSEKNKLQQLTKELNLEENIQFHGNVDDPERYLMQSLIYIHTAIYEPFGLVILEAMAAGLPVVCLDGKGNRDLIREGENGFMIWEQAPKLLADKIQFLLENEDHRQRMGENAYRFAQQFGIRSYLNSLLEIYSK
jgi:glycosyltransferase involved in cell wall biosynthesis